MRLRIISVGRDRSGLFEPAVQEYARRIKHHFPIELVELKAAASPDAEAELILSKRKPHEILVCLDERGKEITSPDLAAMLRRWRDESRDVAFAIGGDEGHGSAAREKADFVWSLSRLVMPHRMVRVIAAEQIYRAITILRGEPYHK